MIVHLSLLSLLVLLIAYICFRIVFYVSPRQKKQSDELPVPNGEAYEPYHPQMKKWVHLWNLCSMAIAAVNVMLFPLE